MGEITLGEGIDEEGEKTEKPAMKESAGENWKTQRGRKKDRLETVYNSVRRLVSG